MNVWTRLDRFPGSVASHVVLAVGVVVFAACAEETVDPTAPPEPPPDLSGTMVALDQIEAGTYHGVDATMPNNGAPTVTPVRGRIVIVAISMSNGRLEFGRYIDLFDGHPDVDPAIGLVNCARGGNALERWRDRQALWDGCKDAVVAAGFDLDQVRVVWAKNADQFTDHGRTLPDPAADYYDLVGNISFLSEKIGREFPLVQAVFHTSRIYGGYVAAARQAARGEPISYEGGLAINEVIRRWQRGELPGAPWLGWGPYLWADGSAPNAAGIRWEPGDFRDDGADPHPSDAGQTKVAEALHAFFLGFDWYRR